MSRRGIFLRIFWSILKVCRVMSTYPNAHAKKWIFNVEFPRNCHGFDIISNDFRSSSIWDTQIVVSFAGTEIRKNPGIQPIYTVWMMDDNGPNVRPVFYWLNLNEKVINLDELVLMISFWFDSNRFFNSKTGLWVWY